MSGSTGRDINGQFIIEDPRSIFQASRDEKVIVYFEWEGPLGPHRFEGYWKNPKGKIVAISEFSYEATQTRFAGYWTLLLSETIPTGLWTLEARVDGEMAGNHTFQIVAEPVPDSVLSSRRRLTPSEIYQRALVATVSIRPYGANGKLLATRSGIHLGNGRVLTAFQAIDGAAKIQINTPDGKSLTTDRVIAWDRWGDWALLETELADSPALKRADPDSWAVGDRCFTLNTLAEGSRVIAEGNLVGRRVFPRAGARLNVTFDIKPEAIGTPVLNYYGEVIGIAVRGGTVPGLATVQPSTRGFFTGYPANLWRNKELSLNFAVPISAVPEMVTAMESVPLQHLSDSGLFVPPLTGADNIRRGTVARRMEKRGRLRQPIDDAYEFTADQDELIVFVNWEPRVKRNGKVSLRLYSIDNQLLYETKPKKVKLRQGKHFDTWWALKISSMLPGHYRIDVVLESEPFWRSFFRITE